MEKEVLQFVTSLHNDYERVVKELNEKITELQKKTTENEDLERKNAELSQDLNNKMPLLEMKLENLEAISEENNLLNVKVELLEAKFESARNEKAAATRELACVQADLERYRIEHNILSSQVAHLLYAINKRDSVEGRELVVKNDPSTEQYIFFDIRQLQQKNIELSRKLHLVLEQQRNEADVEINVGEERLREFVAKAQTAIVNICAKRDHYKLLFQNTVSQIRDQDARVKEVQSLTERVALQATKIERQAEQLSSQAQLIEKQNEEMQILQQKIHSQCELIEEQNKQIKLKNEQIETQLDQIDQHVGEAEFQAHQIKSLSERLEQQAAEIESLCEKLDEQTVQISLNAQETQTQRESIAHQKNLINEQNAEIDLLRQKIESQEKQIKEAELTLLTSRNNKDNERAKEMEGQLQQIDAHTKQIAHYAHTNELQTRRIEEQQTEISQQREKITVLTSVREELNIAVEATNRERDYLKRTIQELGEELKQSAARNKVSEKTLNQVRQLAKTFRNDKQELEQALKKASDENEELKKDIKNLLEEKQKSENKRSGNEESAFGSSEVGADINDIAPTKADDVTQSVPVSKPTSGAADINETFNQVKIKVNQHPYDQSVFAVKELLFLPAENDEIGERLLKLIDS
ncbi:laminin-like protein epi-1 [Ditylenchus destructor]|uniref:Laminin-like protein epi-1 n=1 Tax=Ditylenchus destructor TaxID=166010 RepID=A0AAD4N5H5_9BILA|nr:laminin-like protein epi-1 [Ditylenchus destructor]